jgi:hypothetical protein
MILSLTFISIYIGDISLNISYLIQVEKLRLEHNEVFTAGDTDKDGYMSPTEFFAVSFRFPMIQYKYLSSTYQLHRCKKKMIQPLK